jgi:hypothetical protein
MLMRRLLHAGFAVLAGILVTRAVVETVRADARRARASEEISRSLDNQSPVNSDGVDDAAGSGPMTLTGSDAASVANSLNCSNVEPFVVAKPARNGFVCFSQGRAAHPMTVFIYDPGVAPTVSGARTRRACEKANAAGQPLVYVLTTGALFVYTTSSQAVTASALSGPFTAFDARTCG